MAFRRKKKNTQDEDKKKMGKIYHKRTEIDGIVFDSKLESEYYKQLKQDKADGKIINFELQPEFILQEKFIVVDEVVITGSDPLFAKLKRQTKAPTVQAIKYRSDFKVYTNDGGVRIVDTKGLETADFKIKKKMFEYKYPHLKLDVIIKYAGEWISHDDYKKIVKEKKKAKSKKGQDDDN